jgi:hypothetical protein
MTKSLEQQVRDRVACYLSPEVAAHAQLSLAQLMRVPWGGQPLSHLQIQRLARRMGIPFVWTTGKAA